MCKKYGQANEDAMKNKTLFQKKSKNNPITIKVYTFKKRYKFPNKDYFLTEEKNIHHLSSNLSILVFYRWATKKAIVIGGFAGKLHGIF